MESLERCTFSNKSNNYIKDKHKIISNSTNYIKYIYNNFYRNIFNHLSNKKVKPNSSINDNTLQSI
ncbi:MAG: hypothetical protein GY830_06490 [Bacteroidetes bacterium]|nr:hypothetical protein [Bacteroidota bacterium]